MARTKKLVGVESGNHLTVSHNDDGTVNMKWNWDALLKEVQIATASVKQDIVEVTEAKVKKTRAKKVETQITDAVTAKPKRTKKKDA